MADQNPDFEKYMEGIRQAEADSAEREAMISAHEVRIFPLTLFKL
jgi:hypothetical protein